MMAKIDEIFESLFDELIVATEKQRELHTSAFGKENAQEIIAKAEINRQKLDCWWGLLQALKAEMIESGLFLVDKKITRRKGSSIPNQVDTESFSPETKPVSVTVLGQYRPVCYWKDILLLVCKILYEKHPNRFTGIENEPTLQGRNSPYISNDKNRLRKPEKIEGSPYFVEINLSQIYCKKISYLLLAVFGYTPSDIEIEQINKGSFSRTEENIPDDFAVTGVKVGKRAKLGFGRLLSENKLSVEELSLLCEPDYSKRILGAYLPVLKLIPLGKTADEVRVDSYGRPRYYKDVYTSNTGKYLISSQWFEKQYSQLDGYLAKYGI